jgi:hypothetical protein
MMVLVLVRSLPEATSFFKPFYHSIYTLDDAFDQALLAGGGE